MPGKNKLKCMDIRDFACIMGFDHFVSSAAWLQRFKRRERKMCLFLDNCAAHHTTAVFENIELRFLLANCTAAIQPLDQGVIRSFKAGYRKQLTDQILLNMRVKHKTKIDLYMAIEMLQAAWMSVTANTIANCF